YGLGLQVSTYRGARIVEHGGSDAGYRAWVGRFPRRSGPTSTTYSIAIACNVGSANPSLLGRRIADAYAGGLKPVEAAIAPQGIAVPASQLEKLEGAYFNPATVGIIELVVRDGKLYQGRTGGMELIPIAENRFLTAGGAEAVFSADPRAGFELRLPNGQVRRIERKDTMIVSKATLQPYAGTYFSEELNATYRVITTDTSVTLQTGTSEPFRVRPAFKDAFVGRYTVIFTRKGRQITGMELTSGRSRRVKFVNSREHP
ncbi:MAG: hypothetical protein ACRENU_01390, partial [Gemmatimonadaceae bacterium]